MSLWRGRGAWGMLTCGWAALTTIDRRVTWLLVIEIPSGESYIGGPLDFKTGDYGYQCQLPLWIKSTNPAKRMLYGFPPLTFLTHWPNTLLFTDWLILVRAKMCLITSCQHRKQTKNDTTTFPRWSETLWSPFHIYFCKAKMLSRPSRGHSYGQI